MQRDMSKPEQFIDGVAARLLNDGLAKSNYSREKAYEILSHTVAPLYCKRVFDKFEQEIIKLLPETPKP